ncbi:3-deoxy-manno-octulosonate cytidylyltransferase [Shewanella violacea DSS12]|uniref:8-amino-3,8-dideoxy-manno-octulosonate cytidylyltransferase n=1 Tax=Shewanella violacea (strain JCM 10179 / CIP 106290 / LMG 19151 / DSS12) TaxID=637905 RepID=D4ZFZ7_SHEVD|nr:3-deoxy-manno-octulosonate cytidylyltransferase [Shewanella violacea DSS12]
MVKESPLKAPNYKIIIPARMKSTRLPGKPLALICDQPMIWHVYQRALETNIGQDNIVIATDSEQICEVARGFGAQVLMTSDSHSSGTERCAEVVSLLDWHDDEIVVNLQGDEPLVTADLIKLTASTLASSSAAGMATLACAIKSQSELVDPNYVKLVTDINRKAMLFSRQPMPASITANADEEACIGGDFGPWLRHIGMYSYRVETLKILSALPETELEKYERLEQLRAMWHGIHIQVACVDDAPGHGVDTPADLQRVRAIVKANASVCA